MRRKSEHERNGLTSAWGLLPAYHERLHIEPGLSGGTAEFTDELYFPVRLSDLKIVARVNPGRCSSEFLGHGLESQPAAIGPKRFGSVFRGPIGTGHP